LGFKAPAHGYNFSQWLVFALFTPIIAFFIPFSFLLYVSFGTEKSDALRDNPEGGNRSRGNPEDKSMMVPFSNKTSSSDGDYGTAHEDLSFVYIHHSVGKKDNGEPEKQSLPQPTECTVTDFLQNFAH